MGLAYDDFGAGQARLFELAEVPPHYLKFDRRFVNGIDDAPASRQRLVASLVAAARELRRDRGRGRRDGGGGGGVRACGVLARAGLPLRPAGPARAGQGPAAAQERVAPATSGRTRGPAAS